MLTEKIIRDLKTKGQAMTYWDHEVRRFGVQVSSRGKKNFVVRYLINGKLVQRKVSGAGPGHMRLADARVIASSAQTEARLHGTDPLGRDRSEQVGVTVAQGIDRFFAEFVPTRIAIGKMAPRTVRDYRQQCGQHVRPSLGELLVADVIKEDVERMVDPLTPVRRNRILALTSRLFVQFERWGWRPQNANPCRGIERAVEEPRDKVLSAYELATLSRALGAAESKAPASVAAIRFAAVTGLRISEVLAIRWEDLDLDSGRLVLPSTKTGRRTHDLPEPALAVVVRMPRIHNCPWVFSSGGRRPLSYDVVRQHFAHFAFSAGLTDVRLHDLRRTVMTAAAESGEVNVFILRDLLGHKTIAMAERYIRRVGAPVRKAREAASAAIVSRMEGGTGEEPPALDRG